MELKELTRAMNRFVEAKGWYAPGSPRPQTPRNIAISLSLEAAEVLEHFQWTENTSDPGEISGELADVALYLLQLSSVLGIDLEQAILDKLAKNYHRTWDDPASPGQPFEKDPDA
ncbi:MAG TPA: nucleotide pyrophosphohydrolase [Anaerolineaceae bacterium]